MGKNKKAYIQFPFEHGEVMNYSLDGVSIDPVTTKIVAGEEGNLSRISP